MASPSRDAGADRNLLFGILALQVCFIDQNALVAAMHAWVRDKQKPLGNILVEQGTMTDEQVSAIDMLIAQHLKIHAREVEESLKSFATDTRINTLLARIPDDELNRSLAKLETRSFSDATQSYSPLPPNDGGRYQPIRLHKTGGLGVVYCAEDTELHREVALKEIKQEFADDPVSRARFVVEAEITGRLEHPGIVPVYGLGAHPNGRPFYAMRFIRGESLKSAIEQFHAADTSDRDPGARSLALRQLLRRFVDVCNAIAYAHSRGVLHRDLKPANIMLGRFGETLVVDWGLAKTGVKHEGDNPRNGELDADRTLLPSSGSSMEPTRAGAVLGTPAYMSPEQASGRLHELGQASDIFSLGSTFYTLLTGARPFDGADRTEILAKVRSGRFPPPREVKPTTPPALDAICRKAMSLRPADRYATPLDFAADVEHWLADEPVAAYPEPWPVRVGRWSRRHRTAIVGLAVLLVTAVVGLSISTVAIAVEKQRTEAQRVIAAKNEALSRKQSLDILRLIETTEPEMASIPALHDQRLALLTTASEACRQFLENEPEDKNLQKQAAQLYRFTANVLRLTNDTNGAGRAYRDSLALREKLIASLPDEELLLADTLRDHAGLRIKQGQLAEAGTDLNRALEIIERLKVSDKDAAYRRRKALALRNLASIEHRRAVRQDEVDKAAATLQRSRDLLRGLVDGPVEERHPYDPLLLATALNLEAIMGREAGRLDAADKIHREALQLLKVMLDRKQRLVNEADVIHVMAECQVEQCKTWARRDKPSYLAAAETNMGVAINKLHVLAQDYKQIPSYAEALAATYRERAEIRLVAKNYEGAREHFKSAHGILTALLKKYDDLPKLHGELGSTCAGLAKIAMELKDEDPARWLKQAETELRIAVETSQGERRWKMAIEAVAALSR